MRGLEIIKVVVVFQDRAENSFSVIEVGNYKAATVKSKMPAIVKAYESNDTSVYEYYEDAFYFRLRGDIIASKIK